MRKLFAVLITTAVLANSAAFATPGTLAPGKPAGLHQAQDTDNTLLFALGIGLVAVGIAVAVSGSSNNTVAPGVISSTGTG